MLPGSWFCVIKIRHLEEVESGLGYVEENSLNPMVRPVYTAVRPCGPLPWIAALLVALTLGAFGAAAGSWIAAQTFADLPGHATFGAVSRLVADGSDRFEQRDATPHAVTSWFSAVDRPGWTAGPGAARGGRLAGHRGALAAQRRFVRGRRSLKARHRLR